MTALRLAAMRKHFNLSSTPRNAIGKSPNGQQRTDATGVSPQLSF
nr:MAG TPA: hypothetical protein [Caudoviricetes sp.]